jgi:hypothetical protein
MPGKYGVALNLASFTYYTARLNDDTWADLYTPAQLGFCVNVG